MASSLSSSLEAEADVLADNVASAKKTKYTGAFKYKTKFSPDWKKTWPFLSSLAGNPHQFRCNICAKVLGCVHQGIAYVKGHIAKQSHQRLAKESSSQTNLSFKPVTHFSGVAASRALVRWTLA